MSFNFWILSCQAAFHSSHSYSASLSHEFLGKMSAAEMRSSWRHSAALCGTHFSCTKRHPRVAQLLAALCGTLRHSFFLYQTPSPLPWGLPPTLSPILSHSLPCSLRECLFRLILFHFLSFLSHSLRWPSHQPSSHYNACWN